MAEWRANPFHRMRLGEAAPEQIAAWGEDPRVGDTERGRELGKGVWRIAGERLAGEHRLPWRTRHPSRHYSLNQLGKHLEAFVRAGGVLVTLGNGSTLALEAGFVRHVRKATVDLRTPGAHLRARFPRPGHPIAYGYSAESVVFRSNFTVYDNPRRWTEMAYCTSCLDGPEDPARVVLEWGGAAPIVASGGGRNTGALPATRPSSRTRWGRGASSPSTSIPSIAA